MLQRTPKCGLDDEGTKGYSSSFKDLAEICKMWRCWLRENASFFCMEAVILGFKWAENGLIYHCFNLVNDVLNKVNLNEAICKLLIFWHMEVEVQVLHEMGLETCLKYQLKQVPNSQICWKCLIPKVNLWSYLKWIKSSLKMPFWLARF